MKHYRPKIGSMRAGYYPGYYCLRCGAPGISMMGRCTKKSTDYKQNGICLSNPKLVAIINAENTVDAENKREFVRILRRGKEE